MTRSLIIALFTIQSVFAQGLLLQFDFNEAVSWPLTHAKEYEPGVRSGNFGTIDSAGGKEASGGLQLTMNHGTQVGWIYGEGGFFHRDKEPIREGGAKRAWTATLNSGPLAVKNSVADLGKLTLAFDLISSGKLPVRIIVESFDSGKQRSGGLETTIHPSAADFYQRYALDFNTMKPAGEGTFDPTAAFVSFTFEIGTALGWQAATYHELRLDNVHYAAPAYYVNPAGKDSNDGLTETTAFASPQKAIDAAKPGDIIVLMNGTYSGINGMPVAKFFHPGTPAGWITLKNYPSHKPVLSSHGQNAIRIAQVRGQPTLAYLELRGLNVRGNGDTAKEKFPDELGKPGPNTDVQGVVINGRVTPYPGKREENEIVHHIRLADNVIEFCTADGLYVEYCDWLYVENNRIENNCWTTTGYAPAGFAVMGHANFDTQDNVFKMLIAGNRVSGNRLEMKNHPRSKKTDFYNGNGILLDDNAGGAQDKYLGRTLVQNNLTYNNGGGGIQMWGSHRLDLINNTIYKNATNLDWGQIAMERCQDVRLINNIIVASPDRALDTWATARMDERTSDIFRANNLYWGGAEPNVSGIDDINADPLFENPAAGDFQLKPGSPALKAGRWENYTPGKDVTGNPRPAAGSPDIGAYQR
jgi:hypothetical protein